MNTFYKNFKTQLFIIVVLLSASFGFAQTVTVPANCRVVITGTSGTLGFGGKVGDGGMISMPDALIVSPFTTNQGGTFIFNPPTGVTTANWNLRGDLSNTTNPGAIPGVVGNYNSVVQPPAGLQAKFYSYNKSYRPNSSETSEPSWARSKGVVRLSWVAGSCGSSIFFDVFKTFEKTPEIVGPLCLKPNTTYTYSVDRIVSDNTNDNIGFDSYYWSGLPLSIYPPTAANLFYTSADNSSITFRTGATVGIFTLKCCFGRVNPNSGDGGVSTVNINTPTHLTCTEKLLLVAPVAPVYTTFPPTCVATGTVIAPAIFTIAYPNVIAGQIYTWTAANSGWTGLSTPVINSPIAGTTTLNVNTAGNNNPGELTLTITGSCDPVIFKYQIERNITAPLEIVAANVATTFCLPSTSTNNLYTITPTNSNAVTWYLTAVGTTAPLTPITIPGVSLSNSATQTVTLNTSNAAVGSFLLNVKSSVAACGTTFISKVINIRPAAPTFSTTTPSCVTKSAITQITTVSVSPAGGTGTYSWSLPAGVSFANATAPSNTSSNPTLILNGSGTSSTLSVTALGTNGCNSTPPVTKTINYVGVLTNFSTGFPDQYQVNPTCNNVESWQITAGGVTTNYASPFPTSGTVTVSNSPAIGVIPQGVNNILTLSGSGTTITAICATLVGGIQVCATTIGTFTQRQANSNIVDENIIKNVTITPNPSSGNFIINVIAYKKNAVAVLLDFNGNEIETFKLQQGDNKVEKEALKKGIYFVTLIIDGEKETRQLVIK